MAERLTDRAIAALRYTGNGTASAYHFDSEVRGLAVRVYPSERKVFVFDWRENGRQRRVTVGDFPTWTIGKARLHAGRMRLKADTGETVAPARGGRVADLIEKWRTAVNLTRRPRTAVSYGRLLDSYVLPAFGKLEPRGITRNAVEHWHAEIAQRAPGAANRAIATLSSFLSWLEHDRLIERNVCKGVTRRPENQRHTFLDADEIAAAHAALDAESDRRAGLALRLALLTGCRIGEVQTLTAEQVDLKQSIWIKPSSHTKQKKTHIVPLQAEALTVMRELLKAGVPDYDSCHRAWCRVRTVLKREDVRIHDLRHSRASALARGGASLTQIGKVLGHAAPATTARYTHLVDDDLRDLVERS